MSIPTFFGLSEAQMEEFIKLYPTTKNKELYALFGLSHYKIKEIRVRLRDEHGINIAKTAEFMTKTAVEGSSRALQVNRARNYEAQRKHMKMVNELHPENKFKKGHTYWKDIPAEEKAEIHKKKGLALKNKWKEERRRANWGLPTKTKLKIQEPNHSRSAAKCYLTRNCGYKFVEKWLFEYDENTKRAPRSEKKYGEVFKFRFRPAEYDI